MTKSGMHDNDAFHFVQVAMWEFPGFTPIAVYYFYTRCKEHLDIDSIFQMTMDESLKGKSITVANDDLKTTPSSEESKLTRPSKVTTICQLTASHFCTHQSKMKTRT